MFCARAHTLPGPSRYQHRSNVRSNGEDTSRSPRQRGVQPEDFKSADTNTSVHRRHDPVTSTISTNLEFCRDSLGTALRKCPNSKFAHVAAATSFVLTSFQPMQTSEISAAVEVFVEGPQGISRQGGAEANRPWHGWLEICDTFLTEDSAGFVHFTEFHMLCFLRSFRVSGIDASHRATATACLIQVRLDGCLDCRKSGAFHRLSESSTSTAFSIYADKFWKEHCRIARKSSLMLGPWPLFADKDKGWEQSNCDDCITDQHTDGFSKLEISDENEDGWMEIQYRT